MIFKAGDVFTGVRALMNDQDNAVFTNAVQLEYYKMAFQELEEECQDYSIPITNKTTAAIDIDTGVTDIGGPTGPALPEDLIEPMDCWEIPADTNNNYMKMRQMQFLPKTSVLTSYLEVWAWKEQYIQFLGANGNIQVKLDYVASNLGNAKDENSIIKLTNAINFLKFKTAALCAMFIGENETRAAILESEAVRSLDRMMGIKIKNQQGITTRRRPFMASYKSNGYGYGR